jgi:hypothetical protein
MNQENKIIWEKWVDPFGADLDETKWNSYNKDEENPDYDVLLENEIVNNQISKSVKVISTPMGLIPYNENTASSKIFNFWVGHTNFNLSQNIIDVIEECEGVEILDVFTRYRFRIAIGKYFNDREIMTAISSKINKYLDDKKFYNQYSQPS